MSSPFKQLPTLEQLATRLFTVHNEVRALSQAVGLRVAEHENMVRENSELTDAVLEEVNLKLTFLMSHMQVRRTLNGGLAGPDGRVQVETKPAMLAYLEMRPKLVEAREELLRAQGVSTESDNTAVDEDAIREAVKDAIAVLGGQPEAINGAAHDGAEDILAAAEVPETKH